MAREVDKRHPGHTWRWMRITNSFWDVNSTHCQTLGECGILFIRAGSNTDTPWSRSTSLLENNRIQDKTNIHCTPGHESLARTSDDSWFGYDLYSVLSLAAKQTDTTVKGNFQLSCNVCVKWLRMFCAPGSDWILRKIAKIVVIWIRIVFLFICFHILPSD